LLTAVSLLTAAAFGHALRVGFVGDDVLILDHIERLGGLRDVTGFFRLDYFGYYRPLAFLSHALDWHVWRQNAGGFHLTNLVLHGANGALVFVLARRLTTAAGAAIATVLFVLHPSNHEAVFWIAGRFDLLATFWSLAALLLVTSRGGPAYVGGAACFAIALLSKESALALPPIVAAHDVFRTRAGWTVVVRRQVPLVAIAAGYAALRTLAGLDAAGGPGRLPKSLALAAGLGLLVWLAYKDWTRVAGRVATRRGLAAAVGAVALMGVAAAAAAPNGAFAREKLSFASFALFYLVSPVVSLTPPWYLDPTTTVYWSAGLSGLVLTAALAVLAWRRLLADGTALFLVAFLLASLVPVSSMTEGKRYLYLASAGVAILAGYVVERLSASWRRVALVAVAAVLIVSGWQVRLLGDHWIWAGAMTRDAAALVATSLSDSAACGRGEIVLLTAPVGQRGVYSHFYTQTFTRGPCPARRVQTLVRVVRMDERITARWEGPTTIVLEAIDYQGSFVVSEDLRIFRTPLTGPRRAIVLRTPLGELDAAPGSATGAHQVIRLVLRRPPDRDTFFFYYGAGRLRRLAPGA
jgi:hypothetical protein